MVIWLHRYYRILKCFAWRAFCVGAIVGACFDLDHPISELLGIEDGRFLHNPFFAISLIAFVWGISWHLALLRRRPGMGDIGQ